MSERETENIRDIHYQCRISSGRAEQVDEHADEKVDRGKGADEDEHDKVKRRECRGVTYGLQINPSDIHCVVPAHSKWS